MIKEDNTQKYKDIKKLLDLKYSAYKLQAFYNDFLKSFIKKHEHLYRKYAPFPSFLTESSNRTIRKVELIKIYAPFFTHGELFKAMLSELPKPIPELFEKMIWGEILNHEWIEKTYKVKVTKSINKSYYSDEQELNAIYQIFSSEGEDRHHGFYWQRNISKSQYIHHFYIGNELAKYLKDYVNQPKYYNLEEVEEIPKTLNILNTEKAIFQEFDIISAYISQGQLKMSTSGKLLESSLYKAKNFCNIEEFFPEEKKDKSLATLRSRMLTLPFTNDEFLARNRESEVIKFIKSNIIRGFELIEFPPETLLMHITGWHHFYYQLNLSSYLQILSIIKNIPVTKNWFSVEGLVQYCQLRSSLTHFTSSSYSYLKRSKKYTGKQEYYYEVRRENYAQTIEEPFIRNVLAFFTSWGLIEVAYKSEFKSKFAQNHNIELGYLTPADSFEYFRFTNLGKYAFGLEANYEPPKVEKESVKLDDKRLFLQYFGKNKAILNIINSVATPIDKHLYKLSFETVLGDCSNSTEVDLQIYIIQKLLEDNPPKIWIDFFEALQQKSYTLDNLNEEYRIFQLPDNKELARVIAKDDYLQKHIIKAEYYNILIRKKDINKVKKHLKKSGFLIEFD